MKDNSRTITGKLPIGPSAVAGQQATTPSEAVPQGMEINPMLSDVRRIVSSSEKIDQLVSGLTELIVNNTECLAVWLVQRPTQQKNWQLHSLTDQNATAVADLAGNRIHGLADAASEASSACSLPLSDTVCLVATVIEAGISETQMGFVGAFQEKSQSSLRQQWMLSIAVEAISKWMRQRELGQSQASQQLMTDSIVLCGEMNQSATRQEAANNLVNHLRRILSARQVAWCEGASRERSKLIAVSEVEKFDPFSESSRVIATAASRAIGSEAPVVFQQGHELDPANALPLEAYCRANRFVSCVCVGVTDHEGRPCGSLIIGSDQESISEHQLTRIKQLAGFNGRHLSVVQRANLSFSEFVGGKVRSIPKQRWFKLSLLATAIAVGIMLIPIPYRVGCDCEIQPHTRRFVSAPYTGTLEKSLVGPGDLVKKDQLIALMDGRLLRHELMGVRAEFGAAKKRRDAALAQREVAQSQISRSEMRRLDSRINSLEDQLGRLEVRSPYEGVIISGDMEKAEGAQMEIGQTLFEVAPLSSMLAEVAIPESEIQYVNESDQVAIKLSAFPFETLHGPIRSIHPAAEVVEDDAVFVAEVDLSDSDLEIRPGMKGSAKVKTQWRPLGWNLFHKSWESVRCWTIW